MVSKQFLSLNKKQQKHNLTPILIIDEQLNELYLDSRFPFFILLIRCLSLPLMLVK